MHKKIIVPVRKLYSDEYEEKELELPDFVTDKQIKELEDAIMERKPIILWGMSIMHETCLFIKLRSVRITVYKGTDFKIIGGD